MKLLRIFNPVSEDDISKLIKSLPTKTGSLDPIPTWLVKHCSLSLVPAITDIINHSLLTGEMSDNLKSAVIIPRLKKQHLDPEMLINYRKISTLSYISKLIEKIVAFQLNVHMETNGLHELLQSAYKKYHSTETALIKVNSDILTALDDRGSVLLVLLDFSSAFDTVDHDKLLAILHNRIGITSTALQWFRSYLSDRSDVVK